MEGARAPDGLEEVNAPADRLAAALSDRYRIERELGQGGMATVFLAEDLKHDRKVAIKVLHEDLGATLGPERFLAEIKTTAKLQHPHILTLLDSGSTAVGDEKGGLLYYVMPYVDGESLRDRLEREKQLPIDDAVRIAREIADALGLAHSLGIVHRDIKPENVLLQGGHALVADFGIALAVQSAGGARLTQTGLSLGTPQYMSPEQAMGEKSVDARADIYALGAVTYEMLVGEPPFTGATVQAIVAKVLSSEPEPPTTMRKTIPHHVEDAVLTALAKLPADRFTDVKAFGAALGGSGTTISGARTQASRAAKSTRVIARSWVVAGITLGVFAGVALGYFVWNGARANGTAAVARSYVVHPAAEALPGGTTDFVLSPDGEQMVYVGPGEQAGTTQLWRKQQSELHATRLAGTVGARAPFFSPDGKQIAFYARAGLITMSLAGGAPTTLVSGITGVAGRGAWLDDGRIVFSERQTVEVIRADGGGRELLVTSGQIAGYNPVMMEALPNSRGFVMQTCPTQCPRATVQITDLKSRETRLLLADGRNPTWLPTGHLAWITSEGKLVAARLDLETLVLEEHAVVLLEQVAALSLSRNGRMVYREGAIGEAARLVWVDRTGKETIVDTSWVAHISTFSLAPNGKRVAASIVTGGRQNIWIKEMPSGPLSKFTFGELNQFRPVWSADATRLWFVSGNETFALGEKNADGGGDARVMSHPGHQVVEAAASRDGQWLLMRAGGTDTSRALLAMRLGADTTPRQINTKPVPRVGFAISPDSRHVAYLSVESGTPEIYVSPFPDIESGRWQVSIGTGLEPQWSNDGTELFYVSLKREFMAAKVMTRPTFAVTSTQKLFDIPGYVRDGGFHTYEPSADGKRFLMMRQEVFPGEMVAVDHWMSEVRAKLTAKR
ncbi:MAG: protein kinase [Gemmatimonas sp.]